MSRVAGKPLTNLAQHEGLTLLTALEAILKGVLEAETPVDLLVGPRRGSFTGLFDLESRENNASLLNAHETRLLAVPDASRSLRLAEYAVKTGGRSLVLVPNDEAERTSRALVRARQAEFAAGGAMAILMEDDSDGSPSVFPREIAIRCGIPCIEPGDVVQLRESIELALRLSRAGACPIAIIVHTSILRSADSLIAQPNRVQDTVEAMLARRKRRRAPRWAEAGDVLRMARRLELNTARAIPSPGERVPVGFITVGPAGATLAHLVHVLTLTGRVSTLQLALLSPIDDAAVERVLLRCEEVIVLEPRPGEIEPAILGVAEALRRRGERPASIWGRRLPPDPEGVSFALEPGDALHPSILARKAVHLLHMIRPASHVASQLIPEVPTSIVAAPPRGRGLGSTAAIASIRRLLGEVDQWLRDQAPWDELETEPSVLAIERSGAPEPDKRIVQAEIWDAAGFELDGIGALRQAARDQRPWLVVICCVEGESGQAIERLARGAAPGDRADRVRIDAANFNDRDELREKLQEAVLQERVSVVVITDGPPPQFDIPAIERSQYEIDQLGFQPRQRLVHAIDEACELRPIPTNPAMEIAALAESPDIHSEFRIDLDRAGRREAGFRFRIRPMLEQVDVVRTRPPAATWRGERAARLPLPVVVHGQQPQWRAHVAGFRGHGPGLATLALCEAGRFMGYHVRSVFDPAPIGAGRRACAQVLFTRPRSDEPAPPITGMIPYGEADLLLGFDAVETLRAITLQDQMRVAFQDRTSAVVNVPLTGDAAEMELAGAEEIAAAIASVTQPDHCLIADFAGACRVWFHTDRVADMGILGAAFQMGLIPVSLEAIESGVARVENMGFGRCAEAFAFGRRLAFDGRLFSRLREEREEDAEKLCRRLVRSVTGGWGGALRASRFERLVRTTLDKTPGLAETDAGRQARRDMVSAMHRCLAWGGLEYAARFANRIVDLYDADRGESGRAVTRAAVIPLAESMLIRDPIFLASMAASAEHRSRIRQRLNVKLARGDEMTRRFLTRIELAVGGRRLRADVRTSDWVASLIAGARRLVPSRWRGSTVERQIREYVTELVQRATHGLDTDYDRWNQLIQRLHEHAMEGHFRAMAVPELRLLVEGISEASISNPSTTEHRVTELDFEQQSSSRSLQ